MKNSTLRHCLHYCLKKRINFKFFTMHYNLIILLLLLVAINIAFGLPVGENYEHVSNNENVLYQLKSNTTTSAPVATTYNTTLIVSTNNSATSKPTVLTIKTSILEAQTITPTNTHATTTNKPFIIMSNAPSSSPPDIPKLFTGLSPSEADKHLKRNILEPSSSDTASKSWFDNLHGPSFMIGIMATVCIIGFYKFYKIKNERSFRTL